MACEISEIAGWFSALVMPGVAIPGMSIPSMAIPESAEIREGDSCEWQSESASANAQERSHAPASEDITSSSATTEPAIVRLTIILALIVRQSASTLQFGLVGVVASFGTDPLPWKCSVNLCASK